MSHNFKKFKFLRKILNLFGFKLIEKNYIKNLTTINSYSINVEDFLEKIVKKNKFKKVIQVGAYDGITDDFMGSIIKKYKLISILIEPEPNAFLKLTKNYQSFDNITLINKVLIEGKNSIPKSKKFYIVAKSYLKNYHSNISVLSSLQKNNLIKWGVNPKHISSIEVETTNWTQILEFYKFQDVDLICIDAEGYDYFLVNDLLETTNLRPVIVFEWVNISYKLMNVLLQNLIRKKYKILKFQKDLLCLNSEIDI